MNPETLDKAIESGKVTFFSRTKQRLWTKRRNVGQFPQRSKYCAGLRQRHATGTGEVYRTNLPQGAAAASAIPLTSGCSLYPLERCSPNVNLPTRKPLTRQLVCQRHRRIAQEGGRRAWKPHWQQRYMTALS